MSSSKINLIAYLKLAAACPSNFTCGGSTAAPSPSSGLGWVNTVLMWIVAVSLVITIIYLIIGVFTASRANGVSEAQDQGRNRITHAIVGIALILIGYFLLTLTINVATGQIKLNF